MYRYLRIRVSATRHVVALIPESMPDSRALHLVLCQVDPGSHYVVRFSQYERPKKWPAGYEHVELRGW